MSVQQRWTGKGTDDYEVGDETGSSILDAILKTGDFSSGVTTDAGEIHADVVVNAPGASR